MSKTDKEKELLREELERLKKALDYLSCSSGKYHLVSQAISEIKKELEMSKSIYGKLDPYKTAHEKLIEMGYEHHEYSYGDVYELKESYKYNGLSGRIQTDNQGAINCGDVYIGLELSRILTQYLEELENKQKMIWAEKNKIKCVK